MSHVQALIVGFRASLRAIPLFGQQGVEDPDILAAFAAISSAWAGARFPNRPPNMDRLQAAFAVPTHYPLSHIVRRANHAITSDQSRDIAEVVAGAIQELRLFIADADDAAAGVIFGMSVSDDISDFRGSTPFQVSQLPLWPGGLPPALSAQRWSELRQRLVLHEADWEVWINWYDDRVAGITRIDDEELIYANIPEDIWPLGVPQVNSWILKELEQLKAPKPSAESATQIPDQQPAAIEPIWQKGRLTLSKSAAKTDLRGRAFAAALKGLRQDLQTFIDEISEQANIDQRFVAVVRRLSDQIPRKQPTQAEIFRLGHAETIFTAYAKTVDAEWSPISAAQYHALTLHFERTMRQVPLWREFKRNAAKSTLELTQVQGAKVLASEVVAALRWDEATNLIDEAIPHALEEMANALQAALQDNESPDETIDAGAELLAYDVVESVNNIMKSIIRVAVWSGIPSTVKKAGAKFSAAAQKSIVDEAGRLGKNVGPGITKWVKRVAFVGVSSAGGPPLFNWAASNYPEAFAWLASIAKLFM